LCYFDKSRKDGQEVPYLFNLDSNSTEWDNEELPSKFYDAIVRMNDIVMDDESKNIPSSFDTKHAFSIKVTKQQPGDCGYCTITNLLILLNSGVLHLIKQNLSAHLFKKGTFSLDISVNYGFVTTTKELFQTLFFSIWKKKKNNQQNHLIVPQSVFQWPNYLFALFESVPHHESAWFIT